MRVKIYSSVSLLGCAGVALAGVLPLTQSQLFIGYLFLAASILTLLCICIERSESKLIPLLSTVIIIAVLSAIISGNVNRKLIGFDTQATLFHIQWIRETGHILTEPTGLRGGSRGGTYPSLYTFISAFLIATGIETEWGILLFPLFVLPSLPLFLTSISQNQSKLPVLIGIVPSFFVFFATISTAQMLAYPLVLLMLFITLKISETNRQSKKYVVIFTITILTLVLTHTYTTVVGAFAVFGIFFTNIIRKNITINLPALVCTIILGIWINQEYPVILEQLSLVILLLSGVAIEQSPTPLYLQKNHPAEMEFLIFSKFVPEWLAFGTRIVFFLLLGVIYTHTFLRPISTGQQKINSFQKIWTKEIGLFGIGATSALLLSFLIPDVNFNRFWVISILLSALVIPTLRNQNSKKIRQALTICIVLFVLSQSLYLAPSVFVPDADPDSYTDNGRPLYHTEQEYSTASFINDHGKTPVVSDIKMFFIEPRYQIEHYTESRCYVDGCSAPTVIWIESYENEWLYRGYGSFPNGKEKLDSSRNLIYSTGQTTLYTKTKLSQRQVRTV